MQTATSKIWSQVTDSISFGDNCYAPERVVLGAFLVLQTEPNFFLVLTNGLPKNFLDILVFEIFKTHRISLKIFN